MKLKFIRNRAIFKVMNSTHKMVTIDLRKMFGVVDLRLLRLLKDKARCLAAKH